MCEMMMILYVQPCTELSPMHISHSCPPSTHCATITAHHPPDLYTPNILTHHFYSLYHSQQHKIDKRMLYSPKLVLPSPQVCGYRTLLLSTWEVNINLPGHISEWHFRSHVSHHLIN